MFNSEVVSKFKSIFRFFLSSSLVMIISAIFMLITFITLAIVGGNLSGEWTLGVSFNEWWQSISKSPVVNGKFSAVDVNTCWSCNLFSKLLDILSLVGVKLYAYISDVAFILIIFGFAVWILNYMYKHMILDQDLNAKSMAFDISKKIIMIGVVSVALSFASIKNRNNSYLSNMLNNVVQNTAVPLFKMGLGISSEVLSINMCDKLYYPKSDGEAGFIVKELKNDMLCLMNSVNMVFLSAMNSGSNMVSMSWKSFINHPIANAKALPDVIAGAAVIIVFFLMYLMIPFSIVDIVFTLGVMISFVPLMIASYAYQDVGMVKGFAKNAISLLWHIVFYIVMYSIFLGILYSSFIYIADMYYPGPLDNFTYLFPDFIYSSMVNSKTYNIQLSSVFQNCVNIAAGNISKMQSCLLKSGMDLNMPSFDNPGGSLLPIFTFGIVSLMLMFGSIKTYTSIIGGNLLHIGVYAQNILTSFWGQLKGVTRKASGFVQKSQLDKLYEEELKKREDALLDNLKGK